MNIHCNRCGKQADELLPEAPPPEALSGPREEGLAVGYLVCGECFGLGGPYGFCSRCAQPTPAQELRAARCDWCRAADDIPFEEPADDDWWQGKTPGLNPPQWWPRV